MPNEFLSPEGDLEEYFVDEYWIIDQYVGDELWIWGTNSSGALGINDTTTRSTPVTTFAGGTNWKQVSCGGNSGAAIKTDGTLWTWGNNGSGNLGTNDVRARSTPVTTFTGGNNWKQVSCGNGHTAAVKTDGTLWTWGSSFRGQLGTNNTFTRSTPVTTFAGGNDWKQVTCGQQHTAAIKTDGTLWTWGYNTLGQLGINTIATRSIPVTTFAGGNDWKQVAGGTSHTVAIKTDGTLWTWGNNAQGQIGTSDVVSRSTPVTTFGGGTNWKQIACGNVHTAAIKTDGTLWIGGNDLNGQTGILPAKSVKMVPVTTFAGGNNWADTATAEPEDLYTISGGGLNTAAIKTDGTLWTWGYNGDGRLGTNDSNILFGNTTGTPVTTFAGGTDWKQVAAGNAHVAAIKTDGTLWTWGNNISGQLGVNDIRSRSTPVTTFSGGNNWKQVANGRNHTAAIKTDGTLWTWGYCARGNLGINDTKNRSIPVTTFSGGTNWKQVTCGQQHTAAIKTDGTLWTWGYNTLGQLGVNDTRARSTPVTTFAGGNDWKQVSGGDAHTVSIKTDGTLWTWGTNSGQLGVNDIRTRSTPVTTFAGGTNWKQVNCGGTHTAAIKTDGTLWTLGTNNVGQLGINDTINRSTPVTTFAGGTNWKQVAGGSNHTIALEDDGVNKRLYGFGANSSVQLGTQFQFGTLDQVSNATNWKQVAGGSSYTTAIKTDGTLWVWGSNTIGQLGLNDIINRFTPVTTIAGGTNWKQVSSNHSASLTVAVFAGTTPDLPIS